MNRNKNTKQAEGEDLERFYWIDLDTWQREKRKCDFSLNVSDKFLFHSDGPLLL
jgi:hypothetical protein